LQPQAASFAQAATSIAGVAASDQAIAAHAAGAHQALAGPDGVPAATDASFAVATPSYHAGSSTPPDAAAPAVPRLNLDTLQPLALRIARGAHDGDKVLTVELHPAELGRVDVRLLFHADGVGVQMTIHRADTLDAFTRNRAGLEQQLAQAGINLGSGGLDLRAGQQQAGQQDAAPGSSQPRGPAMANADTLPIPPPLWVGHGLVNIIA